jgi:hypothetical protein
MIWENSHGHRLPKALNRSRVNRFQGVERTPRLLLADYIKKLQQAKWGLGVSLQSSNLKPPMSALKADID